MTSLAVEKLSPVLPSAVLLNNINVVSRVSFAIFSLLLYVGGIFKLFPFQVPLYVLIIVSLLLLLSSFRLTTAIYVGITLRRLRYAGNIAYLRMPGSTLWESSLRERHVRRSVRESFFAAVDAELNKTDESNDYVILVLGVHEESGEFELRPYHSCAIESCENHRAHLRGYNDSVDGAMFQ